MPDLEWRKDDHSAVLAIPKEFSFIEILKVLARSDDECLHLIENNRLYKVLELDGLLVLLEISYQADGLSLRFLNAQPSEVARITAIDYLSQWFDLETNLRPFYRLAERDGILGDLVQRYYGLRLIGIPDLFESLCWAIIGQQINLTFAYTLKRRFVEAFGQKLIYDSPEKR
jgi:DNA-3-methyladenine glycosylase II